MPEPTVVTKQKIEQIFDEAAISYDRVGPSIFTRFGTRLVESIPLMPGERVLDIATGTGAVLLPAARCVGPQGHVTGIDLSGGILQEAKRIAHASSLTNVELLKMDAAHLDFPDQSFDAVTCAFAIFLFPNIEAALCEMYRVCKPGGYIGVTNFNKTPPPFDPGWPILIQQLMAYGVGVRTPQPLAYTPQEVEALLSRSGFNSVETHTETSDIIYVNPDDWWAFQLTLVPRVAILSLNEETRARFKEEYFAKLHPICRQDGLHLPLTVIYTLAKR